MDWCSRLMDIWTDSVDGCMDRPKDEWKDGLIDSPSVDKIK